MLKVVSPMESTQISSYFHPGCHAHLVGIGGVSMAPLAQVLQGMGMVITGSDTRESLVVEQMRKNGIQIAIGHSAEHLAGAELVIRTAAAHEDNPEICGARAQGIPVFERAQAWGEIMKHYKNALCISGTHGKTTTTSMCTHIILAAGLDPTVMIGGTLPLLGAGHRVGHGDTIILESCEYCNSFLSFFPTIAVILNVDADHLDFFKDLSDVEHSFRAFADLVPEKTGLIVANRDDANTMLTLRGETRPMMTFGLTEGDVHAENLQYEKGLPTFDIICEDIPYAHVALQLPGEHNVRNALAAAAACHALGVSGEAVQKGLVGFRGAGRRFERKGTVNGADVYDDYAHHPSEVQALFNMVKGLGYKRIICAFQPHTYSRTTALFDEFVRVLSQADVTVLAEIFAAREDNETGISSKDLSERIPGSAYYPTLEEMTAQLRAMARPGDLILTVGAGDIYTVGESLVQEK